MASGTLTITRSKAPRIVPGGDGELNCKMTAAFAGAETQSHFDSPFKYITNIKLCPIGGIPNDLRIVNAPVDGVIPRDSSGQVDVARTDTTSSGSFFIDLTGHA